VPGTAQVIVNQAPSVSVNNSTICEGSSATLTATPSATGGTYLWNTGITNQIITVSPSTTTNYSITYSLSGCSPVTATGTITVSPIPMVNLGSDTTICSANFPYTIISSTSGATNEYNWNTGDQTQSITITTGGTYSLSVTNTDGCSSSDSIEIFEDPCASLNEQIVSELTVMPNPTRDVAYLKTSGLNITKISIYNAEGQFVIELTHIDEEVLIDMSPYSRGVYFVKAICKEGSLVRKLVKQ
jgi:hypothetical protein